MKDMTVEMSASDFGAVHHRKERQERKVFISYVRNVGS